MNVDVDDVDDDGGLQRTWAQYGRLLKWIKKESKDWKWSIHEWVCEKRKREKEQKTSEMMKTKIKRIQSLNRFCDMNC